MSRISGSRKVTCAVKGYAAALKIRPLKLELHSRLFLTLQE